MSVATSKFEREKGEVRTEYNNALVSGDNVNLNMTRYFSKYISWPLMQIENT